jgi:hypothetical protein
MHKYTKHTVLNTVPVSEQKINVPAGAVLIKRSGVDVPVLLDTLGQVPLSAYYEENVIRGKKNLAKRARSKYITNIVAFPLFNLNSPLQKSYEQTLGCACQLAETAGKITSKYCDQRWCLVCSRIRTAKLIKGYMPQIEAMAEKWFVTCTVPNVKAKALKDTVKAMTKNASLCNRKLREKMKLKYSSLRKLECTYNEKRNDYHPHFHFVFDSEVAGRAFLAQWLERNPSAKAKAQDIRVADSSSCMELFKYFTKVVSKTKGAASDDYRIHVSALDVMFQALQGMRTFQPCGIIKDVAEEIAPDEALLTGREEENLWQWTGKDWVSWINEEYLDMTTGQLLEVRVLRPLTDYEPSATIADIAKHVVVPIRPEDAPDLDNTKLLANVLFDCQFDPPLKKQYATPVSKLIQADLFNSL